MRIVYPILLIVLTVLVVVLGWFSLQGGFPSIGAERKVVTNHNVVLEKIEKMGKLQLVKYKFRDVLEHNIEYDWWPDSKAVLIISGEAVGCIDLEKVRSQDIQGQGDTVFVRLPEPELCDYKINHGESRIYDTKSYSMDETKLIGQAFREAEKQIRRTALESNILAQAKINGEQVLRPMLEQISQKRVIFTYSLNEKDVDLKKK